MSSLDRELRRRSLLEFAQALYPGYHTTRHHRCIGEHLEAVERGEIKRLIIEAPPRHGKSLITSGIFPAWYLGRNPDKRVIGCSYATDLAFTFSRLARSIALSPKYRETFPIRLAEDSRAKGQWDIADHRGGYTSAGVGTGITGKGADLLLIDDPVKDAEEANSSTVLESIWQWYITTAYTRLEENAAMILIATRWSEDDLTGRLLRAMRENPRTDQWTVVHLPALAEKDDLLGREVGEALWPEKYDEDELRRIRVVQGSRAFEAQFQQRPSPPGGHIFQREWWQRYRSFDVTQATQIIQVWDTAFQKTQTADFSVCSTWALNGTGAYVLDVFRDRVEFPELKRKAIDAFNKWRPQAVLVEDRASGQSLIQELRNDTTLPIIPVKVDTDKVSRATAVSPYVEARRVHLPDSEPWVDGWIEEHASFPAGAHDDQVDTTSMALHRLFVEPSITGYRVAVGAERPILSRYNPR